MLDLQSIGDDSGFVRERLARRGKPEIIDSIDRVIALDEERRATIARVDGLRARRNEVSPQVGKLKQAGKHAEAEPLVIEMRKLGDEMSELEARLNDVETAVRDVLLNIPNLPEDSVPSGD